MKHTLRLYHPLVYKILYSRLKTPWDSIIDECVLDKNGNIDNQWANNLDDEQVLRMDIAAFIQDYFNTLNNPQTVEK